MRWLVLLALGGCNQAFNLESTKLIDAAAQPPQPDAPPPPACPAIGTVPRFSDDLRQIPPRNCEAYTVSENGVAMAVCGGTLLRGVADGDMTQTIMRDPSLVYEYPRLAPDGEHVFFSHNDATYQTKLLEFAWTGTELAKMGEYTVPHDYPYGEGFSMSTPSRGPDRHIVYTDYNFSTGITEVVEIADGTGKFGEVARYPLAELGTTVGPFERPSLSPDGLRLVFLNSSGQVGSGSTTSGGGGGGGIGGGYCTYNTSVVMYADRPNTSAHFGPAQVLETIPDQVDWPYMTADCGRIYVTALNRVFYFKQ